MTLTAVNNGVNPGALAPAVPLVRPGRLRKGDTVAFVAPSAPVPPELIDAGRRVVESWGLHVVVGEHASSVHPTLDYLAGTDEQRAADFQWAWSREDVRAVFCLRGGYGAQRFVDLVDWDALRGVEPKALIGYSDITALHLAVGTKLGQVSLHGPMPGTDDFTGEVAAYERLRLTLFEPEEAMVLRRTGTHAIVPGTASGVTKGGCLALMAGDVWTPTATPPHDGTIAMLEDVGEDTYRLDGFLTHLLRSGWFEGARAVVLGSWQSCEPVEALLVDRLGHLGIPVLADLGFGHCPDPITVPLGVEVTVDAGRGTVTLAEPALQ